MGVTVNDATQISSTVFELDLSPRADRGKSSTIYVHVDYEKGDETSLTIYALYSSAGVPSGEFCYLYEYGDLIQRKKFGPFTSSDIILVPVPVPYPFELVRLEFSFDDLGGGDAGSVACYWDQG